MDPTQYEAFILKKDGGGVSKRGEDEEAANIMKELSTADTTPGPWPPPPPPPPLSTPAMPSLCPPPGLSLSLSAINFPGANFWTINAVTHQSLDPQKRPMRRFDLSAIKTGRTSERRGREKGSPCPRRPAPVCWFTFSHPPFFLPEREREQMSRIGVLVSCFSLLLVLHGRQSVPRLMMSTPT